MYYIAFSTIDKMKENRIVKTPPTAEDKGCFDSVLIVEVVESIAVCELEIAGFAV